MSFDLAIWYQREPLTVDQAYHIYDQLTDGIHGVVKASPAIGRFYEALVAIYPEPGEEGTDESPWSSQIDHTPESVILAASWSRAREVLEIVLRLANENGLTVFDPQSYTLYSPTSEPSPSGRGGE